MEVRGICTICGKPGKMQSCSFCGALVCSRCYDFDRKICMLCKSGKKI